MKKTAFVVPSEIRRLLGPAPVLSSEDPNRFEEMLNHFAQHYRPKNALEWILVGNQTVACWKLQRLARYENEVHGAVHKKVVEEAEQARATQAEEERRSRESERVFESFGRRRSKADEKSSGTNARLTCDDLPILSGLPLREAKQRLLSGLLKRRPDRPICHHVERNGITRDHFRDNPKWQEAFDLDPATSAEMSDWQD